MPSWNIHTAQVEKLLADNDPAELGIRDVNAYLFGNFVPDIFVGYMVRDIDHVLNYLDTHFARTDMIPVPKHEEFWNLYIEPNIERGGVDDLTLGVWSHLVADAVYNRRVREFNTEHGISAGEETRIRKQSDFDRFGAELGIHTKLEVTPELIAEARDFGQYEINERAVRASVEAANKIIEGASLFEHDPDEPWKLVGRDFMHEAFAEVNDTVEKGLRSYVGRVEAAGFDPLAPAPPTAAERPELEVFPEPDIFFATDPQAASIERAREKLGLSND
jgi:hypothetical protein